MQPIALTTALSSRTDASLRWRSMHCLPVACVMVSASAIADVMGLTDLPRPVAQSLSEQGLQVDQRGYR